MNRQRGFTLIEAIVALAILALALMACYGWVANNINALLKVRDLALEEAALKQAIVAIEQRDIATQPNGSLPWRGFRIDWVAEPVEPTRRGHTSVGGTSLYDFTLYDVQLRLYSENHLIGMPQVRMLRHSLVRKADAQP